MAGDLGAVKVGGVAGAADCLLLMLGVLIPFPSSRLACVHCTFPLTGEVQYSTSKVSLERATSSRAMPHSGFRSQTQMVCHRTQSSSKSIWFCLLVMRSLHGETIQKVWTSLSSSPEKARV